MYRGYGKHRPGGRNRSHGKEEEVLEGTSRKTCDEERDGPRNAESGYTT